MTPKTLASKMRTLRGKRTLREMAKMCGLPSVSTIHRIENGMYPDIETFRKICMALNADANDLLELIK